VDLVDLDILYHLLDLMDPLILADLVAQAVLLDQIFLARDVQMFL
jgi:hypothetical protein